MKKTGLILLLPLFLLTACGDKKDFTPNEDPGMQLAQKVSIFESKDGQKKWTLDAEEVDFADLSSAVLTNPVLLLKENGQNSAKVTGKVGTFDYGKKLVGIRGNAKAESFKENLIIMSEEFFYDVDKDRVWSDDKTVVTRSGAKVTAKGGVETDSKLVKIEFKKQSTQLPVDSSELKTK